MRLYRSGDQGEPVRDIQDRLSALGFECGDDEAGTFGPGTRDAVGSFQRDRGLPPDGIVGPDTWRTLVGAGYRLGSRMLYHRIPMMRGDDVADLQQRLNALGFDSGKVDGVFGPDTLSGILDFQANRRLPEDGIAGRGVAAELALMARATAKQGREGVRERQWLAELPDHLAAQRVYVDPFCRTPDEAADSWQSATLFAKIIQDLGAHPVMSRSADTAPPPRVRAIRGNRLGVDLIVGFALPSNEPPGVFYFASALSKSRAGEEIAGAIGDCLSLPTAGRAVPLLKDTRAPAALVAARPLDAAVGGGAAQGLIDLFAGGGDRPN